MLGMDLIFPSYAQHERMTAALEAIALNGGAGSLDTLDVACKSLFDGTNTTRIFWEYYPRAVAAGATDKYDILCRFAKAAAQAWNNKTYTLRSYDAAVSGNTEMTPMNDLAKLQKAQLCTESTEAVEDWADEDPMTWYIRANALSKEDGTMNITFFEGEDGFDITEKLRLSTRSRWHCGSKNGTTEAIITFLSGQRREAGFIRMRATWIRRTKSVRSHGTRRSQAG